jgi:hypothetical protein
MANVFGAASSAVKDGSKSTSFSQSTKEYYSKNSHMVSAVFLTNYTRFTPLPGLSVHVLHLKERNKF